MAHTPTDAFIALRDGIATGEEAVEKQRPSFELVNEAIARVGLSPEEVVLAWSFHTRSEQDLVNAFVAMKQMVWELPVGSYTILEETTDSDQNRVIDGLFETPEFRDADGYVHLDDRGLPIRQGTYEEEFRLTIPESVDETRPVIVYGHGFLRSYDQSSRDAVNQLCRERRLPPVEDGHFREVKTGVLLLPPRSASKPRPDDDRSCVGRWRRVSETPPPVPGKARTGIQADADADAT